MPDVPTRCPRCAALQVEGLNACPRCHWRYAPDSATASGWDVLPAAPAGASTQPPAQAPRDTGVAGASAQREFERRRAKREAAIDVRFGRFAGVMRAVTTDPQTTRAWATGASGERRLAAVLAEIPGINVLHDRSVPGTRGNIDHIVIGQTGVFIVDTKMLVGLVEIQNRGSIFRADYRLMVARRDRSSLARNMGWQVDAVRAALQRAGPSDQPPITPVLCFVGASWPLIAPPKEFEGVRLESECSIKRLLAQANPLPSAVVDRVTQILASAFPSK